MKNAFHLICFALLITSCGEDLEVIQNPSNITGFCLDNPSSKIYDFAFYDFEDTTANVDWTIDVPECFDYVLKQGIDSHVGAFVSDIDNVSIDHDFGYLAGVYVRDSTLRAQSIDFEFWYEKRDSQYFFSFPEINANFFTTSDNLDPLLDIMKTVAKN